MFPITSLPRTLEATFRDVRAKRVDVRKSALQDLVRHSDGHKREHILPVLRQMLRADTEPEVRALAAVATADAGFVELVADLFDALDDASPRVQQMVLLALGELTTTPSDAEMARIAVFLGSELPALRYQAISTLFRLRPDEYVTTVMSALRDSDPEIQWLGWQLLDDGFGALRQLTEKNNASLSDPALFRELLNLASAAPPHVRIVAGTLLLRVDPNQVFEMIKPLLERPRGLSSGQLERVIARLGETQCQASVPWLKKQARVGWFEGPLGWISLCALARLGDSDARKAIVAELRGSSAKRRCRALEAVKTLRLTEALGTLESFVKSGVAGMTRSELDAALFEVHQNP